MSEGMHCACAVPGCGRTSVNSRGWCSPHYQRWQRHGGPLGGRVSRGTKAGEPQAFVDAVIHAETDECIDWPFVRIPKGYGHVYWDGRMRMVHRVVCARVYGGPPTSKHHAAHNCGRPSCCNPRHIRWATPSENNADKVLHGTHQAGEVNGGAKLTARAVRECRGLAGTVSLAELARRFGVTTAAISLAVKGKTWRHV